MLLLSAKTAKRGFFGRCCSKIFAAYFVFASASLPLRQRI